MTVTEILMTPPHSHWSQSPLQKKENDLWAQEMTEMLTAYLNGETIYVSFEHDLKRVGSIGKLTITNIQDILQGQNSWYGRVRNKSTLIEEKPENIKPEFFLKVRITGNVRWDERTNKVNNLSGSQLRWHKGFTGPTVWAYGTPAKPLVKSYDKLQREISVGDFISYILYHFDNDHNAAGIYYGKVTKIEADGTVWAKNIKLAEDDRVAEKRIKDSSLIVIMSKDLMDKLMMARLSIL